MALRWWTQVCFYLMTSIRNIKIKELTTYCFSFDFFKFNFSQLVLYCIKIT